MTSNLGRLPITVTVIVKNEAARLPKMLEKVAPWAARIIVVDSGSTDDTLAIARRYGAEAHVRDWTGYGPQKQFAESLATTNWVLNLDADEVLNRKCVAHLHELFATAASEPPCSAYRLNCRLAFPFEDEPRALAPDNSPIRLYRRDSAGFRPSPVHDSVVVRDGKIGRLRGHAAHYSYRDWSHWIEKLQIYTSAQAADYLDRGRPPPYWRLWVEPGFAFFKAYILRRYALYGVDGFVAAQIYAFWRLMRLAKARELARLRQRAATPPDARRV